MDDPGSGAHGSAGRMRVLQSVGMGSPGHPREWKRSGGLGCVIWKELAKRRVDLEERTLRLEREQWRSLLELA